MTYKYMDGADLRYRRLIGKTPHEFVPSTDRAVCDRGEPRPAYPGLSAKELMARDVFAHELVKIREGSGQSVGTMLERFDHAIRVSTLEASRAPQYFENSDNFFAAKIAKAESKEIGKLRAENIQLHQAFNERQVVRHVPNAELVRLTDLRKADAVLVRSLHDSIASTEKDLLDARTKLALANVRLEDKVNELHTVKSFWTPKKKLKTKEAPMSKFRIAAGVVAAAVLAPLAFNVAKDGWSEAYASVAPVTLTNVERLAELETLKNDNLRDFAREYVAIKLEMENEAEVAAFTAEVLAGLGMTEGELEASVALVER